MIEAWDLQVLQNHFEYLPCLEGNNLARSYGTRDYMYVQ